MKSKASVLKITIITLCSILAFAILTVSLLALGERVALGFERYKPSYEMIDISEILEKDTKDADDYRTLYEQTGLTKEGVDSVIKTSGADAIFKYQNAFFYDYKVRDFNFAIFSHYYFVDKNVPIVPLQNGDIIVSSSTEFSFWSVGHCALVVDAEKGLTVEAIGIGDDTKECPVGPLSRRGNFIVLRPKANADTIDKIVNYVRDELVGTKYDPTVGILSRKYVENIEYTQCAHAFWYAFYKHGIDIDSNGGCVVLPKDIALSEHFEVIQVSGFDPYLLWGN